MQTTTIAVLFNRVVLKFVDIGTKATIPGFAFVLKTNGVAHITAKGAKAKLTILTDSTFGSARRQCGFEPSLLPILGIHG